MLKVLLYQEKFKELIQVFESLNKKSNQEAFKYYKDNKERIPNTLKKELLSYFKNSNDEETKTQAMCELWILGECFTSEETKNIMEQAMNYKDRYICLKFLKSFFSVINDKTVEYVTGNNVEFVLKYHKEEWENIGTLIKQAHISNKEDVIKKYIQVLKKELSRLKNLGYSHSKIEKEEEIIEMIKYIRGANRDN